MNQANLLKILDELPDTALYVIRRDNHELLYFNQQVRNVAPNVVLGMACHNVWPEMCGHCPLNGLHDGKPYTETMYNHPFGPMVDVTASEVFWNEIPAYLLSIVPHRQTDAEKKRELEREQMSAAASRVYERIISVNLTRDAYDLMADRTGTKRMGDAGRFSELVREEAVRVHADERQAFQTAFSLDNLLKRFEAGDKEVYFECRHAWHGEYHWIGTRVMPIDNPFGEDRLAVTLAENIDDEKRTEEQLKHSFKAACELAGGLTGKYLVREDRVSLLEANRRYYEFFGITKEQGEENAFACLDEQSSDLMTQHILGLVKNRSMINLEFPYVKDGRKIFLRAQASCIGEQEGWPVYFGSVVDVTQRVQRERELQATYDDLPGSILKMVIDESFTYVSANETCFSVTGRSEKDFARGVLRLIHEEDRAMVEQLIRSQAAQNLPIVCEFRLIRGDGAVIWLHVEGKRIGAFKGYPLYLIVAVDITRRKDMERALAEEQLRYRLAAETSNDILFEYLVKEDLLRVYQSGEAEHPPRSLERFVETLEGEGRIHPDDMDEILAALSGDKPNFDLRVRSAGSYAWYACRTTTLMEQDRPLRIIGTLRNIDRVKKAEANRQQWEKISSFAISKDYVLLATVDVRTGRYTMRYTMSGGLQDPGRAQGIYDDRVRVLIDYHMAPEDRAEAQERMTLSRIIFWLQDGAAEHSLYYRCRLGDAWRWLCISFAYLDEGQDTLLMGVRDIEHMRNARLKEELLDQSLKHAMSTIYEEIFYANLNTGAVEFVKQREALTHHIHRDDRQEYARVFGVENVLRALAQKGMSLSHEYRRLGHDGLYHWVNMTLMRSENDLNGDGRIVGFVSNIDERRRAQSMREDFFSTIATLFEECSIVNLEEDSYVLQKVKDTENVIEEEGRFSSSNEAYCRAMIHPEDQAEFRKYFSYGGLRRQIAMGKTRISKELRRLTSKGVYHWVEMVAIVTQPAEGEVQKIICTFRDIEEIKRIREEQRSFGLSFAVTIRDLYVRIFEANVDRDECYSFKEENGALTRSSEPFPFGAYVKKISAVVCPDFRDEYLALFMPGNVRKAYDEGKRSLYFEHQRFEEDGSRRWYATRIQFLAADEEGLKVMMYLQDVDEIRREKEEKENALRDALAAAEQANRAKSEFLSRMSHDIRTPMNGILGMTAIARTEDNPPRTEECLDKIEMSGKYLLHLVNDILDMSKIESGKVVLAEETIGLSEFLGRIESLVAPQAQQKGLSFLIELGAGLAEAYRGDGLRLNQVLMNLLGNAVKYTPEGGHIVLRVNRQDPGRPEETLAFEVEDDGVGMSPEFLERMYEPFEQAQDERAGIQEGTGLGLSITRNLVRLMNGRLEVESELGEGTRFTVLLPLKPADPEPAEARTVPAEPSWQAFQGKRVLVVEDNELNMEIAKTILEMKGFVVDMAANGREGVDQFAASEPGLYFAILMDIRMPVMDGLAAARAIRTLDRPDAASVPIVAMSANAFHEEIAGAKRAGINDYLTKPIDTIELFAKLDRFVHEMRK